MPEPADDLAAFAALKGWPVTHGSNGQLFCRGPDAGLRWHVWTNPPILGPLLTMVVEAKSGLSFELVAGPKIRPGLTEYAVEEDSEGQKHLVNVREISPAVESWINGLEADAFIRLELQEHDQISVNPETVAITFQAKGLDHALYRARTLLEFVAPFTQAKGSHPAKGITPHCAPDTRMVDYRRRQEGGALGSGIQV